MWKETLYFVVKQEMLANFQKTCETTKRKGQTNLHCRYMIGAIGGNQKSWLVDEKGNELPKGEFHTVRGSMGCVGGTKDLLCQEILEVFIRLM